MLLKKLSDFGGGDKSDSEVMSYYLMLNSGERKHFRSARQKQKLF